MRKRSNCLFHEVSPSSVTTTLLLFTSFIHPVLSKCETEVKQAGSHLMYLCCWLTLGPAITLLLYFVNIRVHLYKGMILQLPPCDIWQVTKLKFLDMHFNQDYIQTAPCAWTFSVHMSRGLGKCCCAVILIITGVVKVKGTGKEVWSVCECCAASLATPTSCCAQTSDNRWHTQRDAQMFTPLLTAAPTQTKYA